MRLDSLALTAAVMVGIVVLGLVLLALIYTDSPTSEPRVHAQAFPEYQVTCFYIDARSGHDGVAISCIYN